MDRLKTILTISLVLAISQIVVGQKKVSKEKFIELDREINEIIHVSTNNSTFITGENLNYKIFCLNKDNLTPSYLSKVAYVELVNENKQSIAKQKIFLNNGSNYGDFFIPTNLETGNYKLIAYSNWMLNFNSYYFQKDITIINPYKISNKLSLTEDGNPSQNPTLSNPENENITLTLDKDSFSNREAVKIKIKANNKTFVNGNYILSVAKKDHFPSNDNSLRSFNIKNFDDNSLDNLSLPELRGEVISGKIIAKNSSSSVENKNIALSISGKSFALKISKTDKNGNFTFVLDEPFTNPNIIVQLVENKLNEYKVELTPQKKVDFSQLTFENKIIITQAQKKSIENRLISSQIENAYYEKKADSILPHNYYKTFLDNNSKEFVLDDYNKFPTIKETLIEIVPRAYIKKHDNSYSIYIDDYNEGDEMQLPSLVIVDGLFINNLNEFFEYSPRQVDKINIIYGGYQYESMVFNGVISFTTKNFDFNSKAENDFILKPELLRPSASKNYYTPNYNKTELKRIPDYRNQLLWLPTINLQNNNQEIEFFTSDVKGLFEISIEGFNEKGTPLKVKKIFEVK